MNGAKLKATLLCLFVFFAAASTSFAYSVYMPHITGGYSTWTDYLQVDNDALSSATFSMVLYDSTGYAVYDGSHEVAALSQSLIRVKDYAASAVTGVITYSSEKLKFRLSYRNSAGGVAEFRLADTLTPLTGLYFSSSDVLPDLNSKGAAIANMSDSAAAVTLYAVGDGAILDSYSETIGPFGKIVGTAGSGNTWFTSVFASEIDKIIAVSTAGALTGVVICSDSDVTKLLFTPSAPLTDFETDGMQTDQTDVTGTWAGTWTSTVYSGESGAVTAYMDQSGTSISGTVDVTNTDCGDVTGVPMNGTVSGNTVTINATHICQGHEAELRFTQGVVTGNVMDGIYVQYVDSFLYDSGTFSLTKQ